MPVVAAMVASTGRWSTSRGSRPSTGTARPVSAVSGQRGVGQRGGPVAGGGQERGGDGEELGQRDAPGLPGRERSDDLLLGGCGEPVEGLGVGHPAPLPSNDR